MLNPQTRIATDSIYVYICDLSVAGAALSSNDSVIASVKRLALLKLAQNSYHLHLLICDIDFELGSQQF
jgi:hypothetical protein